MGFVERPARAAPVVAEGAYQTYYTAYQNSKGIAPSDYDKRIIRAIIENEGRAKADRKTQADIGKEVGVVQGTVSNMRKAIGLRQ